MEEFVLFFMTFIFLLFIYQILFVHPAKKKSKKEMIEIRYLKSKYPLDFDKISYSQLLQLCTFASCFDIAVVVTVVALIDSFLMGIIGGFILLMLLIVGSYHLIYLFYKRKGMVING